MNRTSYQENQTNYLPQEGNIVAELEKRVIGQHDRLGNAVDSLREIADRMFGSVPEPANPPHGTTEREPSRIQALAQAITDTEDYINGMLHQIERLSVL